MAANSPANPGPPWGFRLILRAHRCLPRTLLRTLLWIGTAVALLLMRQQRQASREYWQALTGKPAGWAQLQRHFFAFTEYLVLKITAHRSPMPDFCYAPGSAAAAFESLCASDGPALFGTFHVGHSDLLGCLLSRFGRQVSLVRLQVANSLDTEVLESVFKDSVRFIWINQPEEFLFSLKGAIEAGKSIGLQCDRIDFGGRREAFEFLGAKRWFPFTIYHLSALFQLPVVFAFSGPVVAGKPTEAYTSEVFYPCASRRQTLAAARQHFQQVLNALESHLQKYPQLWFNFLPLNPLADESA